MTTENEIDEIIQAYEHEIKRLITLVANTFWDSHDERNEVGSAMAKELLAEYKELIE